MLSSDEDFTACFGGAPPGEDYDRLAALARHAVRKGFAVLLNDPGSKKLRCPLTDRQVKIADREAAEAAAERGHPDPQRVRHQCGPAHAFVLGEDNPRADDQVHRTVQRLTRTYGKLNLGLELGRSRLVAVDVDTPQQNQAFLEDFSAATGCDETMRCSYTVASPGQRRIEADGSHTWLHHGGGHYLFTVPDGVELPARPGKLTVHGDDPSRAWTVMWHGVQVLVPPSVRAEGPYRVVGAPKPLPDWLREKIEHAGRTAVQVHRTRTEARDPNNAIDTHFAAVDWDELLLPDGWSRSGTAGCGCATYTAPGEHTHPRSATAHDTACGYYADPGSGLLHLWTDFPPEWLADSGGTRTFTKLRYLAASRYGGDLRAALDAVGIAAPENAPEAVTLDGVVTSPAQGAAGATDPLSLAEDRLFGSREVLSAIREFARARGTAPWAMLGCVLARVAAEIGPHVQLPPIVGSHASLNLLVGIVGPSSSGKGLAIHSARDFLAHTTVTEREIGTGQGIDVTYVTPATGQQPMHQVNDTALFTVAEIDQIGTYKAMQSSSLQATLKKAFDGDVLGGQIKDASRRVQVSRHSYRFAAIVGIQPAKAGPLLDDAEGGTPQRWLWIPNRDPGALEPDTEMPVPAAWDWTPPASWAANGENTPFAPYTRVVIDVCDTARETIRRTQFRKLRGEAGTDELDGHRLLTRLKVAAVLGLLEQRAEVTDTDWHLAGLVLEVSDAGRAECQRALSRVARQRNRAQAESEAERREIAAQHQAQHRDERMERVEGKALDHVHQAGADGITGSALRRKLASRDRDILDEVLDNLADERTVVRLPGGNGGYRYWTPQHGPGDQ